MATTEERIRKLLVDQLGIDAEKVVPAAAVVEDLGADSLDVWELAMALEEEFDIEVLDEELEPARTVGDVVKLVDGKVGK